MTQSSVQAGLSAEQVAQRRQLGQVNRVKPFTSRNMRTILRANLLTLFNGIVFVAFMVLLALGQWADALFGLAVIINVAIGITQEVRSKLALDRLSLLGQKLITVRRSSLNQAIPKEQLVLSDLMELKPGDQLVVDAVVLESTNLEVDESLLTGESNPVAKANGDLLLSGTLILAGSALASVSQVGEDTYANQLSAAAKKFRRASSEIRDSINKVVRWISWLLLPLIAISVLGQTLNSKDLLSSTTKAVASVISMIPQGLVLISSITFALSAIQLAKRKVLVQELAAVEGLARVDILCFDKTGTLTTGKLRLNDVILLQGQKSDLWKEVLGALVHSASANATAITLRDHFPKSKLEITHSEEFNSTRKYSSVTTHNQLWKLGAPEILAQDNQTLSETARLASLGFRVLVLGIEEVSFQPQVLIVLSEEINPEAKSTLEYFRQQGVQLKILSGDNPKTVAAVAKAAGLDYLAEGYDSRNLDHASSELLGQEKVFGRVTPLQKQQIISGFQSQGRVVGMVGDGVNDLLALKQADLGIAMGSGSAAARAASDLILINNDFSQLPEVVLQGRRVIGNVERLANIFLTKTAWAMSLAIVFGLALWEFPFIPRQIAAIDAFTIGIPAFLIALLPNHKIYQPGFLSRALRFCLPAGLITALSIVTLKITAEASGEWATNDIQTATCLVLAISGLSVLSIASRPWDGLKIWIYLSMLFLGGIIFFAPVSANFFQFETLAQDQLQVTLLIGTVQAILLEAYFQLTKPKSYVR